jgi:beta-lactamase superfamily II metal-dependent hydrolase
MRRSPRCCGLPSLRRALASACLALLVPAVALALGNGKLQIHHIDVGQGDGALLISPLGQTALFDDGVYTDCTNIKAYLQGLGISTVDYHFCSHYHADHLGCIDDLAAVGITIGTAGYDRAYSYSSASYTSYVNTLGAKRQAIAKNQTITLDAGSANPVLIKCIALNGDGVYPVTGSDENAKSVVLRISYGAFDEEISGDLTGDAGLGNDVETGIGPQVGDIEVYKVHHHGSRYSSNDNWLNATTPEVAVISCGNGNTYGHPTVDALTRLHNHGVKTYWTETGAGVAPNPTWDKVGGTIVVQADPGVGANYTVSGSGFSDTYVNGGGPPPPPPINTTQYPSSLTMLKGSLATGDYTRLALSDDSRIGVSAGVTSGNYYTDWYGSVFLAHPPLNLTARYEGSFTVSRTQTLYLWNWGTSAWVQINSGTVSTTDVVKTWNTTSPAAYVGPSREVRFRVKGNNRSSTYTSRGDLMSFNYDYTSGTAPMAMATGIEGAPAAFAAVTPEAGRPNLEEPPPLGVLRRAEASRHDGVVELTWAVDAKAHVDGFNLYRENASGERVFAGHEALLESRADEVRFRYIDADADAGGTYWLGARACSGPEGMLGPIRTTAVSGLTPLEFAATPNPAQGALHLRFTLEYDAQAKLQIFDVMGRHVATPFAGLAKAGKQDVTWSLASDEGARVESGIYFARLETLGRTLYARVAVVGN